MALYREGGNCKVRQLRVPVLVDGDRWIANSWTIANYLEDTYPDAPFTVRRTCRAGADPLIIRHSPTHRSAHLSVHRARYTAARPRQGSRVFSQESRRARGHNARGFRRRPRHPFVRLSRKPDDRCVLPSRRSLFSAETSRFTPIMRSSGHSNGLDAQAHSSCWRTTIQSGSGAIACSIRSTAWRARPGVRRLNIFLIPTRTRRSPCP